MLTTRLMKRKHKAVVLLAVVVVTVHTTLHPCGVHAFSTRPGTLRYPEYNVQRSSNSRRRIVMVQETPNNNNNDNKNSNSPSARSILNRFSNPIIDDPAMPLTEAGLVQIVAPTLQLFWIVSLDSPYPSWAQPLVDTTFTSRGAFLAPTLIHGAGLACCWLLGCLAAKAYEKPNFRITAAGDYRPIVSSTIQAGAFACGLLIFATQVDLYQEFQGYVQVGESATTDARIYRALVEVINDIVFEFIVLLPWRIFRSNFD